MRIEFKPMYVCVCVCVCVCVYTCVYTRDREIQRSARVGGSVIIYTSYSLEIYNSDKLFFMSSLLGLLFDINSIS